MFSKKSLLAISIGLAVQSASFAVEIGDYNYRGGAGDEQFNKDYNTGVDMKALVECGYNYATGNCNSGNPSVQKGYGDSTNISKGTQDARAANQNKDIYDPSNPKNLGINEMDDNRNIVKYSDTRDLTKQQTTITDLYGGGGDVSGLKSTYNTNVIPDKDGVLLKNKCMQYSDSQLSTMSNSSNKADVDLANQCLVIRTVANSNDQAIVNGFSATDPLRSSTVKRSTTNIKTNNFVSSVDNNSQASIKKANDQAYSCEIEPTRSEYLSTTCNTKGVGRQQMCTQDRVVTCGSGATGTRDLPECVSGMDKGTVKLTSATNGRTSTFVTNDDGFSINERWRDNGSSSGQWDFNFLVKNPERTVMTFVSFYFDNKSEFFLNGKLIASADSKNTDGSRTLNLDLSPFLVIGQNTLIAKMTNYDGPAAMNFVIKIDPSTYTGCQCKESWVTTCNITKVEI
ncbi:hypothetical protein [Acinetobacter ursingii]|uniref:hypothetical protein n=1 Tax=Acinetobacter ursingii TaxID=108980 RepID=UPI00254DCB4E|nr:hypothetical protein [Acinetobacter ursingii]MEC6128214.1 hypothetical protein [Acinetobacter ursingii]